MGGLTQAGRYSGATTGGAGQAHDQDGRRGHWRPDHHRRRGHRRGHGRHTRSGKREMESLDRGVIAINQEAESYVGWRMFGSTRQHCLQRVPRDSGRGCRQTQCFSITSTTDYVDPGLTSPSHAYHVVPSWRRRAGRQRGLHLLPTLPPAVLPFRCATAASTTPGECRRCGRRRAI